MYFREFNENELLVLGPPAIIIMADITVGKAKCVGRNSK